MVWYVAFIALVNLGLGYALATILRENNRRALAGGDTADYDDQSSAEE